MSNTSIMSIILLAFLILLGFIIYLVIKSLKIYIKSKEVREEKNEMAKSLGQLLKDYRTDCKMTQEFVAEYLGVSRQAVSKWENGTSDPSTTNLMALGELYGVAAEEILKKAR